jgi:hypothetical protein
LRISLKRPLAFGTRSGLRCPSASRVGGRQAEHDGDAAHHLRPEHLVEIGLPGLEIAHAEPDAEQGKAERRQLFWIAAPFHLHCDRRGQELRDSHHQHDLPDLERAV